MSAIFRTFGIWGTLIVALLHFEFNYYAISSRSRFPPNPPRLPPISPLPYLVYLRPHRAGGHASCSIRKFSANELVGSFFFFLLSAMRSRACEGEGRVITMLVVVCLWLGGCWCMDSAAVAVAALTYSVIVHCLLSWRPAKWRAASATPSLCEGEITNSAEPARVLATRLEGMPRLQTKAILEPGFTNVSLLTFVVKRAE
eukprot:scaffold251433_cov30-Tisochrysis_lutea.AAC.4